MRDTVKRLVSLLLVLVMVIGMFPTAYAAETTVNETETAASLTDPPDGSVPTEETLSHADQAVATEESTPGATEKASATTQSEPTPTESSQIAKEARTISGTEVTDSATASAVTDATETPTETQYHEAAQETVTSDSTQSTETTETPATEESTAPSEESTEASEAADSQVPDATEETVATEDTQVSESTEYTDPTTETQAFESSESTDSTDVTEESQASEATTEPSESTQAAENAESTETTESAETATSEPPEETTSANDDLPTEPSEETIAPEETLPISDPTADVESSSVWEATFANITLTGDPAADLLAIATSQLGYTESVRNFVIEGEGEDAVMYGYTRYGAWYGLPYGDWCAMFVSFCLNYAGLTDIPTGAGCQSWIDTLTEAGLYYDVSEFNPAPGDVIFYDLNGDGSSDHVGIVFEVTEDGYVTIEGNYSDMVTYVDRTDDSEVMGFLRISGVPEIFGESRTVYGEWFTLEEVNPYGVATMAFDWSSVQGSWYEREYIYWDGSETLDFTYNGVSVSEDHMTIHGMIVDGAYYRAYCIDPGIRVGTGDYTGTTSAWESLSQVQQQAIGLALLYGYPTTLDSSDYMTGIAQQLATQVIIQEIRLGWRSTAEPYSCTNQTFINFLMNRTGLATANGVALSQTALKSAYDSISNSMANHWVLPKFADGTMGRAASTAPTIKLSRQSDGTYKWTGTDSNGVLSKMDFASVSGLSVSKSGNTLTITAANTFSGTKTITATKAGAPLVSSADFAIFKYNSGTSYQDILITDGEYDPIPAYLNIEVDATSSMQLKKTAERGNDVAGYDIKFWNSTTGDTYTLKTNSSGVGCVAKVNGDGSYTITGGSTIEGFTAGTYDILEVLANKGKGVVYPSYITIDIQDSSGKSITGDSWPQTFYSPGGTELSDPVEATQNSGATGTITIDSGTGNARLNNVTFSESDLGAGKAVVITINNDKYHGDVTLKKTSTNGSVSDACFKIFRWTSGDTWYVKTNSSGVGYKASYNATSGSYTRTTIKGFQGATDGTYDMIEDLVAMGLAGQVFPTSWTITVYNSAGKVVSTKTYTEAAGEITKDDNGNARLKEITISGIAKGGYVSMTINNEPTTAPFRVKKTTSTGSYLSGWIFSVYSDSSCKTLVTTLTTTSTGYTSTVDLEVGKTYYVKETGHTSSSRWNSEYLVKDTSKKSVTIVANTTNSVTFTNTFLGKLSVSKETNTNDDLDGWEFGIYTKSNCASSSLVATIVSGEDGIATSENLTPGTYYVKETGGEHYDAYWEMCTEIKTIVVSANNTTDPSKYVFDNTEYGRFKVKKTTNTGTYLQNWEFTAYTDKNCTKVATDKNGDPVVLSTGSSGTATSPYVLPGTYYLKETGGPYFTNSYWNVNTETKTVTVEAGATTGSAVTFDQEMYGTLSVQKVTNTGKDLAGWVFTVYTNKACTKVATDRNGKNVTLTTNSSGYAISTQLPPGTYYVKETSGTDFNSEYWVVDGTVQTVTVVEMKNTPLAYDFENTNYGRFTVQKTTNVNGKYLGNWEFTAYTDKDCTQVATDKNGDPVILYTDANGSATSGYVLPRTYYVKETGGDYFDNEYWENSQEVQSVVVVADQDTPLNYAIENTTYGRAKITKTLVTDGPLDGWVFKITDAEGNEIEGSPFTTDANGTFTTGNILPGVYTVEEILPEDSVYYCTTDNPQTITVKEMEVAEATFTNALIPAELHVEKVDGNGNPMQGVKFLLEYYDDEDSSWKAVTYSDNKYVIKGKSNTAALNGSADCILSTDADGKISYTNLYPTIRYRLTEISTLTNNTLLKDYAFEGELPYTVDDTRSFTITVHVVNSASFEFPKSGEYDLMLTTIGPVLIALAIAMSLVFFAPTVFYGTSAENKKSYLRKEMHK